MVHRRGEGAIMRALAREIEVLRTLCTCRGDDAAVDEAETDYRDLATILHALVDLADTDPFTPIGHAIEHVFPNARAVLTRVTMHPTIDARRLEHDILALNAELLVHENAAGDLRNRIRRIEARQRELLVRQGGIPS
jgi:hypothetical protein